MEKNIGKTDRIVRAVVGVALILWALTGGPVWAWIGILPLATAGISFCPAYKLLGMHT
jgi:hypothetical protein